jgi:ABC-type sugar transport system permease subunit
MTETTLQAKPIPQAALRSKEAIAAGYRPKKQIPTWTIVRHLVLIVFCALVLFPLLWVVLLSVKSLPDAYQNYIWPKKFEWDHYRYAWDHIPTLRQNYWNSIFVTLSSVVVTTICATLAGYALVFLRTPGKSIVTALFVASLFFPTRVTAFIGIFQIQNQLGLINKAWGLDLSLHRAQHRHLGLRHAWRVSVGAEGPDRFGQDRRRRSAAHAARHRLPAGQERRGGGDHHQFRGRLG